MQAQDSSRQVCICAVVLLSACIVLVNSQAAAGPCIYCSFTLLMQCTTYNWEVPHPTATLLCPCRAIGKVEEAITHYIERIRLGGWAEERFMSALNIADQAKLQWETGQLISPQVCVGGGALHGCSTVGGLELCGCREMSWTVPASTPVVQY